MERKALSRDQRETGRFIAFAGHQQLASGTMADVALSVKHAGARGAAGPLLIFDDATGEVVDADLRGTDAEVVARFDRTSAASPSDAPAPPEPRKRGRPTLGVVGREITLLPRHWDWLAAQPGGSAVTLRRLVDEARRGSTEQDRRREAQACAYRFMSAIAGDLPGFEEATRALFAGDRPAFDTRIASWPVDVAAQASRLAFPDVHQ